MTPIQRPSLSQALCLHHSSSASLWDQKSKRSVKRLGFTLCSQLIYYIASSNHLTLLGLNFNIYHMGGTFLWIVPEVNDRPRVIRVNGAGRAD